MARLLIFGSQIERNTFPAFGQDEHALLEHRVTREKLAFADHLIARRAPDRAQSAIDNSIVLIREKRSPDDLADCLFPGHLSEREFDSSLTMRRARKLLPAHGQM